MKYNNRGRPPILTPEQKFEVYNTIVNNMPYQLQWDSANPYRIGAPYWTGEALQTFLLKKYGISIAIRTASKLLAEWKLTTRRRPRAHELDECFHADYYRKNPSEIPGFETMTPVTLEMVIVQKARLEVAMKVEAEKEAAQTKNSHKKLFRTRRPSVIVENPEDDFKFEPPKRKRKPRNVNTTALEMEILTGRLILPLEIILTAIKAGIKAGRFKPEDVLSKLKSFSRPVKYEEEMEIETVNGSLFRHRPNNNGVFIRGLYFPNH